MSGFLSGYKPNIKKLQKPCGNLKLRKKLDVNQYTDNPPLRRSSYMTDDDSVKDFQQLDYPTNIGQKKLTQTEVQQNVDQENKENDHQIADTVIDSMCTRVSGINVGAATSNNKENVHQLADTVIDTMCTRVSEIHVKSPINPGLSESLDFESKEKSIADTVIDSQNSSRVLQEIDAPLSSRKSLFRTKNDSISSDEKVCLKESMRIPQDDKNDTDESSDVIEVLDTDDEDEINQLQPATLKSHDSYVNCSTVGTHDDFFNNPPLLPSNVAVTHSMIKPHPHHDENLINTSIPLEVGNNNSSYNSDSIRRSTSIQEHVEIPATDESEAEDDIIDLTLDNSGPKMKSSDKNSCPISVKIDTDTPKRKHKNITNINIKFDLKISIKDGSASESNDESISSKESSVREEYLKAIPTAPYIEPKSPETDKENSSMDMKTPTRQDMPIIDKELQSMLHDLYGNDWKTPQVMSSFKIKKFREELRKSLAANNFESFVGNLANDLESTRISSPKPKEVVRNMPSSSKKVSSSPAVKTPTRTLIKEQENIRKEPGSGNLTPKLKELTKNMPSSNKNVTSSPAVKTPTRTLFKEQENIKKNPESVILLPKLKELTKNMPSSNKKLTSSPAVKTPIHNLIKDQEDSKKKPGSAIKSSAIKNPPKTPLHLLCDPDTESDDVESSSDDDFNPDDTWNASSDEEYQSEKDRIKKRQSIKQSDMIFTLDDSIDDVLKKYEFKAPPQMETTEKPSRRKLFTHSHFDEDEEIITPKKELPKAQIDSDKKKVKKTPTIPGKALKGYGSTPKSIGKSPKIPTSLTKTPSMLDSGLSKSEALKRFSKYSFLKSLDAEANKLLCDPDALYYRENYKTKKQELADKLFKLYNEKVFNSELSEVPIKWNKKLQTTGGRCNNSRRSGVRNSLIELSDKVLTSADRLRCTLIHEMCHAATWIMNGENGHGATWKKWTGKANSIFPELPKISVCHSYVIEYKFTYMCINCKARSQAHTKAKKVDEIRCSICKGDIQLFENKKNKDGVLELVPHQPKEPTAFAKFVKLKFKEVKKPHLSHKEVMQILSAQFSNLGIDEKAQL